MLDPHATLRTGQSSHFLRDDTCDESAARGRIVEESTDAVRTAPSTPALAAAVKMWE